MKVKIKLWQSLSESIMDFRSLKWTCQLGKGISAVTFTKFWWYGGGLPPRKKSRWHQNKHPYCLIRKSTQNIICALTLQQKFPFISKSSKMINPSRSWSSSCRVSTACDIQLTWWMKNEDKTLLTTVMGYCGLSIVKRRTLFGLSSMLKREKNKNHQFGR